MRRIHLLSFAMFLAIGTLAEVASANPQQNGRYVNGPVLNGRYVNGRYVNGRYVNTSLPNGGVIGSASVEGMKKYETPVYQVYLDGSEIVGLAVESNMWTSKRGAWFEGAELSASLEDPSTGEVDAVKLRIDRASAVTGKTFGTGAARDPYWHYSVSVGLPDGAGSTSWEPLCGVDAGPITPVSYAIALRGSWDYSEGSWTGGSKQLDSSNQLTFACEDSGALGKCAGKIEYGPWEYDYVETCNSAGDCHWVYSDLVDTHQACTRMVRADYCGDGISHTVNGTNIDVFDDLWYRHQVPSPNPYIGFGQYEWQFEGGWDKNGVVLASCGRLQDNVGLCPEYMVRSTLPSGGIGPAFPVRRQHEFACFDSATALNGNNATIGNFRKTVPFTRPRGPSFP